MLDSRGRTPAGSRGHMLDDGYAKAYVQFPNERSLLEDHIKPHRKFIKEITSPHEDPGSFIIKFHPGTAWPQIVMSVVQMQANQCWKVDALKKEVTLWWD